MAKYKEPDSDTLEELRKPLRQELACLDKTYDSYKLDEHAKMIWGNHIMALKGAVLCVSWISYVRFASASVSCNDVMTCLRAKTLQTI